jgi:hypothetical protein
MSKEVEVESERKPYSPPVVESSRSFETLAMNCGKSSPTGEDDICNGGPLTES